MNDQSLQANSIRPISSLLTKNLPLKKRRSYRNFPPDIDLNQPDLLQLAFLSPPQSPHIESIKRHQNDLSPTSNLLTRSESETFHSSSTQNQQQQQQQTTASIDEHFRKSLGENYDRLSTVALTPVEDSVDEHFARSLSKFWPLNNTSSSPSSSSLIDEHFAKALGTTTWEKLKEKSDH